MTEDGANSNDGKREEAEGALPRPSSDANISIHIEEEDLEDSGNVIAKLDRKKRKKTGANGGRDAGGSGLRPDDFYPHASQPYSDNNESGYLPQQWPEISGHHLELSGSSRKHRDSNGNTMPAHSDDEVTPRRGLEEQMSESRLRQLDEEVGGGYPDDSRVVHPPTAGPPKHQAWRSSLARPRQNHDGMSSIDLNEREEMEVSVDLGEHDLAGRTPADQKQPSATKANPAAANKQMTTPRLFLGLEPTGRGAEKGRKPGGETGGKNTEDK